MRRQVLLLSCFLSCLTVAKVVLAQGPFDRGVAVKWEFIARSGIRLSSEDSRRSPVADMSELVHFFRSLTNGEGRVFWENGKPYVVCTVSNSFVTGAWTAYYANGRRMVAGRYDGQGEFSSRWVHWYPSGKKFMESFYKAGRGEGLWVKWSEKGKLLEASALVKGIPAGKFLVWDERGRLIQEGWYEAGEKRMENCITNLTQSSPQQSQGLVLRRKK
jgi:hypothetical protein